jgi:O-antigen ligase
MRFEIALATIDAVKAAPATGNGFGAFIDYYPLYARESERATINKAHNDYLEALSDLGVAGGLAMIFAPAYLVFLAARGVVRRRRGKIFGAVAVAAAAICGVHALFDFSLQVPAVGLFFYTALGIGVAQAWRGEDEDAGDPRMSA